MVETLPKSSFKLALSPPTKNEMDFLKKAKKVIEAERIVFDIVLPD